MLLFLARWATRLKLDEYFFSLRKLDEKPFLKFLVALLVQGKWKSLWETRKRRIESAIAKAWEAASQFAEQRLFGEEPLSQIPTRAWLSEGTSLAQITFSYGICRITVYLIRNEFFLDPALDPESWKVQSLFTITRPADGKGKYVLYVPNVNGFIKGREMPWYEMPAVP